MDALVLVPLLAVIVFLALYPQGALKRSESSASASVAAAHAALTPITASVEANVPATQTESGGTAEANAPATQTESGGTAEGEGR